MKHVLTRSLIGMIVCVGCANGDVVSVEPDAQQDVPTDSMFTPDTRIIDVPRDLDSGADLPADVSDETSDSLPDIPTGCGDTCGAREVCRDDTTCVDLCTQTQTQCGRVDDPQSLQAATCGSCSGAQECIQGQCVAPCPLVGAQCGDLEYQGQTVNCGLCQSGQQVCVQNTCTRLGYRELAVGAEHTCVSSSDGSVKCWGQNEAGQLGEAGAGLTSRVPVSVAGLVDITSVDAYGNHTCALGPSGLWCWGMNDDGQVGNGARQNRRSPYKVLGLGDVRQFSTGERHTCIRLATGRLQCWGFNRKGQLGVGSTISTLSPKGVQTLSQAQYLSAGSTHTCASESTGLVYCWGDNGSVPDQTFGRLGTGDTGSRTSPALVSNLSDVARVHAGRAHTCALTTQGAVWCWGDNDFGQMGTGDTAASTFPVELAAFNYVRELSLGANHTCAIDRARDVWCWGRNDRGQLGIGNNSDQTTPVKVSGLANVLRVSLGVEHTCVTTTDSRVLCWGSNSSGQLGDGTISDRNVPTLVQ